MDRLDRRAFLMAGSASLLGIGCMVSKGFGAKPVCGKGAGEFHAFSKMFQSPVTNSPEELCDIMKGAGYDGIQWTVRQNGHVRPEDAKVELPRLCRIAESRGLRNVTICTDITADRAGVPGLSSCAEEILKVAADCGGELKCQARLVG